MHCSNKYPRFFFTLECVRVWRIRRPWLKLGSRCSSLPVVALPLAFRHSVLLMSLSIFSIALPALAASADGTIKLRSNGICVDSFGAKDDSEGQTPIGASKCSGVPRQSFLFDASSQFVSLSEKPDMVWESFFAPSITVFSKSDSRFFPDGKHFEYDDVSGAIRNIDRNTCLTWTSEKLSLRRSMGSSLCSCRKESR